ncbi:MAG: alpha/beta fold hydrolase, partial [Gammaproteobacteria bacterium]|nr:alpha/beta fold hydrolase [Gammaproteobacteria bacterium]
MNSRKRLPGTPEPMTFLSGGEGLSIAADCWGRDEDPLVVLLHGGGQTRHAWKGTGEALAKAGLRTCSLDARGHGDSDWSPDGEYEQDAMVGDLVSVVEHLGDPRPVLVGASMGGGVALCAAGEGRIDARAVVIVDMAPRVEQAGARRIIDFMRQKPNGFGSLEEVADAIASYQPHRRRPRVLDGLKKNVR